MRTIKHLILGGIASLFLAVTAQAGPSTAAEREQTRRLNIQAAQRAQSAAEMTAAAASNQALAPIALNSLYSPPAKIATAAVADENGTIVGAVQKVELDQSGKPTQVEIALLGSNRIVALQSGSLSYDLSNNVLTASFDKNHIAELPGAG